MEYWSWWIGAIALGVFVVLYGLLVGKPLGVSGSWMRVANWKNDKELKEAEAFYRLISQRDICNGYFEMFNFENFGGTPVLGVNAPLLIGHGISNDISGYSDVAIRYQRDRLCNLRTIRSVCRRLDTRIGRTASRRSEPGIQFRVSLICFISQA